MNTEYLKEFVVLAETKNFWEASERLYMNQSTLSKHIKMLEENLGIPLFTRTTRRVALTHYGAAFLPYAKAIAEAEFGGVSAIKRIQNVENGLLSIGTMPSMPQYHVTQFLAEYQKMYPNSMVKIVEDDPSNLLEYLKNEECELIFNREDKASFEQNFMNQNDIVRIPYMKDRLVAVMHKSHALACSESINLNQLKDERFCMIKEGSLMHHISMNACQNAGFIPDVIFTSHRTDSIIDMVTNQNCIALLMDIHVIMPENGPVQTDIPWVIVPVTPEINSQVSICYRADKPLSASAQNFIELCNKAIFD